MPTITTIRPDATVSQSHVGYTRVGGNLHAILSDNSDASYLYGAGSAVADLTMTFPAPTIPAGRQITRIRTRLRVKSDVAGSGTNVFLVTINGTGNIYSAAYTSGGALGSIVELTGSWSTSSAGTPWSSAMVDAATIGLSVLNGSGAGGYVYEIYLDVEYTDGPAAPTAVTPAAGSTITTDTPTLGANVGAEGSGRSFRVQWQIATDAGFTTGLRTITEPVADLRRSGLATEVVPDASLLAQGTWHIRARKLDDLDSEGDWSASHTFTVAHPPSATGLSPALGTVLDYGTGDVVLSYTFSDPSPLDYLTAHQIVVEHAVTAVSVLDTGKVAAGLQQETVTISSLLKGEPLVWKVRCWDSDDVVGAYSDLAGFYVMDPPVVTISSPTDLSTVNNPSPTVTWTVDIDFTAYRVTFVDTADSTTVHDSGWLSGEILTYTPSTPILENGENYEVTVYVSAPVMDDGLIVLSSNGLVSSDVVTVDAAWTPPDQPTGVAVDVYPHVDDGYVSIAWDSSDRDPMFLKWRVYRRETDAGTSPTLLVESDDTALDLHHDWMACSQIAYEYSVVQVADRFGAEVESIHDWQDPVVPASEHYWLIHPTDETLSFQLFNVTSDDYTDEYEQETYVLLGRPGRKTDFGERLGVDGELAAQLRDKPTATARAQRQALMALRDERGELYLRNPFGDIFLVTLGNVKVARVAGVGAQEFVDISVPYTEVA